jgi:hypothetical protein
MKDFGQKNHFLAYMTPQNSTSSAVTGQWIDLKDVLDVTFLLSFGVITATSADQNITVTVEAISAGVTTGSGTAIAFNYRKSGAIAAVNVDTMGAITAATSSGISVDTTAEDAKMYVISVDPAVVLAGPTSLDGRYVRLIVTPDAGASATYVSCAAVLLPRHAATTMVSSAYTT